MIVVSVLLSSEYPIALTCWPEQSDVYAERPNGELTTLPFAGALMITLAKDGRLAAMNREVARVYLIESFMSPYIERSVRPDVPGDRCRLQGPNLAWPHAKKRER